MAKKKGNRANQIPTKEMKIRTTPHVVRDLERLVDLGYFGKTPREAAEQILREGIRKIMREEGIPQQGFEALEEDDDSA